MIMTGMIVFIIFCIAALLTGKWSDIFVTKLGCAPSISLRFGVGGCLMILIGILSCFAGGILSLPPAICMVVAAVLIFGTAVAAYIVSAGQGIKSVGYFEGITKTEILLYMIFALITVFEIASVILYQSDRIGMLRPVLAATRVYDTGRMAVSDPMMMLIGCIASLTGIHPLSVIFTLIPAPMIFLYNVCPVAVAKTVCGRQVGAIASVFTAALAIWGYQSEALIPFTLLLSWFSTGVYIVYGVLSIAAALIVIYLRGRPKEQAEKAEETDEGYLEEWDMNRHRIINARNLAIAVGVLAVAILAAVFVLNNKINKLYDATVNLQSDMNSRCSVYEFVPDSGASAGYLLRESDGTLTFVGGGPAENADALREFLERYGIEVEKWYAYGQDEADSGAMRELIRTNEVSVDKTYVIDAKELTK
ncbi:MAG: hypothetical protein J5910_07395 [Lachnospiraceae bacterium]|nr:hypothetical protein [Lachnospiraceae bacterium]